MEDFCRSINRITKTDACTKAYQEPRYDSISEVTTEGINEVSYNKGKKKYSNNIHMTSPIIALI